jgi:hypothetical protein
MKLRSQTKLDNLIKDVMYFECLNNAEIQDNRQDIILNFFSTFILIVKETKNYILRTHTLAKIQQALDEKWLEPIYPQLKEMCDQLYAIDM